MTNLFHGHVGILPTSLRWKGKECIFMLAFDYIRSTTWYDQLKVESNLYIRSTFTTFQRIAFYPSCKSREFLHICPVFEQALSLT